MDELIGGRHWTRWIVALVAVITSARIMLALANSGVGPAKVESFELSWNGKAYATSQAFLADCCGFLPVTFPADPNAPRTPVTTGEVAGVVIRAGETRLFLAMPYGPDNRQVWRKLDRARFHLSLRACYCSVFDECWVNTVTGRNQLDPAPVDKCPVPAAPYTE